MDLTLFKPILPLKAKKILGLSEREFILFVGRIDAIKGIDVLIKAVHHLSHRHLKGNQKVGLIIIGGELDEDPHAESQEMQKLRKMVSRMKLQEKVAFWGLNARIYYLTFIQPPKPWFYPRVMNPLAWWP